MDAQRAIESYVAAWNRHDAAALVATFAEGGTYADPTTGGPLAGQAIGAYAAGLWSAFPDLSFEIVSVAGCSHGQAAFEWVMRGTNSGPQQGLPPTGRRVELPGADIVRIGEEGIRSVTGYFDTRTFAEQLGLQAVVQPRRAGPFTFGTAVAVRTGKRARPGAFSITAIYPQSGEQVEYIRDTSRQIAQEMLAMPGFVAWSGINFHEIMMTVTAWERPEDVHTFMQNEKHRAAVRRYYGDLGAAGAMVSTWAPVHISAMVRCERCGRMARCERAGGACSCGAALPEPLPYW